MKKYILLLSLLSINLVHANQVGPVSFDIYHTPGSPFNNPQITPAMFAAVDDVASLVSSHRQPLTTDPDFWWEVDMINPSTMAPTPIDNTLPFFNDTNYTIPLLVGPFGVNGERTPQVSSGSLVASGSPEWEAYTQSLIDNNQLFSGSVSISAGTSWHISVDPATNPELPDFYTFFTRSLVMVMGVGNMQNTFFTDHFSNGIYSGPSVLNEFPNGVSMVEMDDFFTGQFVFEDPIMSRYWDGNQWVDQIALFTTDDNIGNQRLYLTEFDLGVLSDLGYTISVIPEAKHYAISLGVLALLFIMTHRRKS